MLRCFINASARGPDACMTLVSCQFQKGLRVCVCVCVCVRACVLGKQRFTLGYLCHQYVVEWRQLRLRNCSPSFQFAFASSTPPQVGHLCCRRPSVFPPAVPRDELPESDATSNCHVVLPCRTVRVRRLLLCPARATEALLLPKPERAASEAEPPWQLLCAGPTDAGWWGQVSSEELRRRATRPCRGAAAVPPEPEACPSRSTTSIHMSPSNCAWPCLTHNALLRHSLLTLVSAHSVPSPGAPRPLPGWMLPVRTTTGKTRARKKDVTLPGAVSLATEGSVSGSPPVPIHALFKDGSGPTPFNNGHCEEFRHLPIRRDPQPPVTPQTGDSADRRASGVWPALNSPLTPVTPGGSQQHELAAGCAVAAHHQSVTGEPLESCLIGTLDDGYRQGIPPPAPESGQHQRLEQASGATPATAESAFWTPPNAVQAEHETREAVPPYCSNTGAGCLPESAELAAHQASETSAAASAPSDLAAAESILLALLSATSNMVPSSGQPYLMRELGYSAALCRQ